MLGWNCTLFVTIIGIGRRHTARIWEERKNMNAVEIEAAVSDLTLQAFDGAELPFAFLAAFGDETTLSACGKATQTPPIS